MLDFFLEGGWGMFPVLIVGLVLVGSAARFAMDREPARWRFVSVLSLALLAMSAQAMLTDFAKVCHAVSDERIGPELRPRILLEGAKESLSPGILGLGLIVLALVLVSIGVYRAGRRELDAARG